ncbi:MAG: glycogen/starch synthase, partial [Bacteroidales bacterium]
MQGKGKILFVNQEMMPYVAETPMGKLGRCLPQGIQEKGFEVRSFMPRYGLIN